MSMSGGFTGALTGSVLGPQTSAIDLAVNLGYAGSKDNWFLSRKDEYKETARLLTMRLRRQAPLLHIMMQKFPKLVTENTYFQFYEKEYVPTKFALTAITTGAHTTFTLGTTNVKYVSEGDYLLVNGVFTVLDSAGGILWTTTFGMSETTTGTAAGTYRAFRTETVRVVSRNLTAGTITVTRGYGKTASATTVAGTDAAAGLVIAPCVVASGTYVLLAEGPVAEVHSSKSGFRRNPETMQGQLQTVASKSWYTTRTENLINHKTAKPRNEMMRDLTLQFLKTLERTALFAGIEGLTTVDSGEGTSNERRMTSIMEKIPTGNFLNYGKTISYKDFTNTLKTVFDTGSSEKYFFVPRQIMYELSFAFEQRIELNIAKSIELGMYINDWITPDGKTLHFVEDRELENLTSFENNSYGYSGFILDFGDEVGVDSTNFDPYIQYASLRGGDIQMVDVPNGDSSVIDKGYWWGEVGIKVGFADSQYFMYGVKAR